MSFLIFENNSRSKQNQKYSEYPIVKFQLKIANFMVVGALNLVKSPIFQTKYLVSEKQ